jgi:hypothetical protein
MYNCTNENSLKEEAALRNTSVKINERKQTNQALSSNQK